MSKYNTLELITDYETQKRQLAKKIRTYQMIKPISIFISGVLSVCSLTLILSEYSTSMHLMPSTAGIICVIAAAISITIPIILALEIQRIRIQHRTIVKRLSSLYIRRNTLDFEGILTEDEKEETS